MLLTKKSRLGNFEFLLMKLRKPVKLVRERKKSPTYPLLPGELLVETGSHSFSDLA